MLFNGFRPLFQALSPADVNRVSFEIIQVFQGEGGTMESLLRGRRVADQHPRRPGPGDRQRHRQPDDGDDTLAERDQQLSDLVVSLQQFVTGLAEDRDAIFDSLQTIDDLATTTSGFLRAGPAAAVRGHPGARASCRAT